MTQAAVVYDEHLTVPDPALQAQIKNTPIGMMHWAGSGPADATCFSCTEYNQRRAVSKEEKENALLVHGGCGLWQRVMEGRHGECARRVFDLTTPACSHYVKRAPETDPPTLYERPA